MLGLAISIGTEGLELSKLLQKLPRHLQNLHILMMRHKSERDNNSRITWRRAILTGAERREKPIYMFKIDIKMEK